RSARALDGPPGAIHGEADAERRRAGRRGLGASEARRARSARALDGPPGDIHGEADAERRRAGRRGLGASEARRARSARALDGPPGDIHGEADAERRRAGRRGLGASEARRARSARALDGPPGDKMPKIFLVCRRELGSMCGGPLAWVLAAVFLLLTGYFFYSDLALFVLVGGANQTRGLWRFVFLDFRLVALLVVPLVTM